MITVRWQLGATLSLLFTDPQELMPWLELDKVAKLVSYLCSDAAEIINGVAMTADGGWTSGY